MRSNKNKYLASLETRLDFLETELSGLNELLIQVGFSEGIKTLRESAVELLAHPEIEHPFEA